MKWKEFTADYRRKNFPRKSELHGNAIIIGRVAAEFQRQRFQKWLICLAVPQIIFWEDLTYGNTQFAFSGCDSTSKENSSPTIGKRDEGSEKHENQNQRK